MEESGVDRTLSGRESEAANAAEEQCVLFAENNATDELTARIARLSQAVNDARSCDVETAQLARRALGRADRWREFSRRPAPAVEPERSEGTSEP